MGERLALVVATGTYDDAALARLRSPVHDAAGLAEVLGDPAIGGFAVTSVVDRPRQDVQLAVEEFLDGRGTDDLVLVYLSCHGLRDARGRLFYAASDTRRGRLASTGVESTWLLDQLDDCRARRQILILDCCFSGAFAHRAKGHAGPVIDDHLFGAGRGRVVLTASRAGEYSIEGEPLAVTGSVFTTSLVDGLRTGAADLDGDGRITVEEAYGYVFERVRRSGVAQTPQRWVSGGEGRIVLARSPVAARVVPESIRSGLNSPHEAIRLGAVVVLCDWTDRADTAEQAAAGRRELERIAGSDDERVAAAAREYLHAPTRGRVPVGADRVDFAGLGRKWLTDHGFEVDVPGEPDHRLAAGLVGVGAALAGSAVVAGTWVTAVLGLAGATGGLTVYFRARARRTARSAGLLLSSALVGAGLGAGVMGMVVGSAAWVVVGVVTWVLAAAPHLWFERHRGP
jgi:hypothetical protein